MPRYQQVSRLANIPGIGVDRMGNAADAAHDPSILRLENLDTDITPPSRAREATQAALDDDNNNSYLPFLGQHALRQAVAARMKRVNNLAYDWNSQIIISAGGMSGILNCLLATLEPGDIVIVTDPTYAGIINRIYLAGGTPIFVPLIPSSQGWELDITTLSSLTSLHPRMIIISPGMPTGHILTHTEWQAVADFCQQTDCWLLYDAAMERILYDGRQVIHPASFPNMKERTITVGAASKELRMIGWRIGWIVGPEEIMRDVGLVSISNVVCQTGISMPGVTAALNCTNDGLTDALTIWQQRRDVLLDELKSLPIIPPHGGWSLLINFNDLGLSPHQASEILLQNAKIATTPMSGWGKTASRYLRLVFSNEPEQRLIGIGAKIKKALNLNT